MISIQIRGDQQVIQKFGRIPAAVHTAIKNKITFWTLQVLNKAKVKVSGDVLNVRTGNLRANIFSTVNDSEGSISGQIAVSKTIKYAAIHEFGGIIHHPGGTAYYFNPKTQMMQFVSNKNPLSDKLPRTRPHDITMPERSYLRSSLADYKQQILDDLKNATSKALK